MYKCTRPYNRRTASLKRRVQSCKKKATGTFFHKEDCIETCALDDTTPLGPQPPRPLLNGHTMHRFYPKFPTYVAAQYRSKPSQGKRSSKKRGKRRLSKARSR